MKKLILFFALLSGLFFFPAACVHAQADSDTEIAVQHAEFNDCNNDIVIAKYDKPSGRLYIAINPAEKNIPAIAMSSFKELHMSWYYSPKDTPVNGVLHGVHKNQFNRNGSGNAFANWFGGINTHTAGEAGITISPAKIKSSIEKGKIVFYIKLDKSQLVHLQKAEALPGTGNFLEMPRIWLKG